MQAASLEAANKDAPIGNRRLMSALPPKDGVIGSAFLWTSEGEATLNLPRRRFLHFAAGAAALSSSIEYVRAGKLRALAVTTATRSQALPDIPTVGELATPPPHRRVRPAIPAV